MMLPQLTVDLFLEDRDVKKLLEGKTLAQKAQALADYYNQDIKSFGLDTTSKLKAFEVGFFYVTLSNKVTIRVFDSKADYAKKVLKVK